MSTIAAGVEKPRGSSSSASLISNKQTKSRHVSLVHHLTKHRAEGVGREIPPPQGNVPPKDKDQGPDCSVGGSEVQRSSRGSKPLKEEKKKKQNEKRREKVPWCGTQAELSEKTLNFSWKFTFLPLFKTPKPSKPSASFYQEVFSNFSLECGCDGINMKMAAE